MRPFLSLAFLSLFIASCANDPYKNLPEGTASETAPEGYEEVVYGDITYWHRYGHYYRYWPSYGWIVVRPPHNRPPYPRPPRPEHPIERPPASRPPSVQPLPANPQRPVTRPAPRPAPRPMPMPRPVARPALR